MFTRIVVFSVLALPLTAQWQAIGPFGGAAAVVQADPHRPDTVLAATSNALIFRSVNAGDQWEPVPFPAQLHGVLHAFLVDPNHADVYWAGLSGDSPANSGLFMSADAGATWTSVPSLRGKEVWSIAIWGQSSRVIAVGTHGGVYITRDGGESWKLISSPANREMEVVVSLAFDPVESNILYAGTPHLPWKTSDGGLSWRPVPNGMLDDSDVFSINADPRRPQLVFASACSGIYSSPDGGGSWKKLTGAQGASYRTYFVSPDPRQPETVFAGTTHGLVKSTDGGQTWRKLSDHLTRYVAFDQHHPGRIFVATDDDGVERSDDEGETLIAMNNGFCNRHLPSLAVAGRELYTNTIYAAEGGVLRFQPERGGWDSLAQGTRLLGEQVFKLVADSTHASRFFAATYNSLLVSADSGMNWAKLPSPDHSRVTALLGPDTSATFMLLATETGLYRSTDAGKS